MTKLKVYHYSNRLHSVDDVISAGPDSYDRISDLEQQVEDVLRPKLTDGALVRGGSLYAWRDEAVGQRMWRINSKAAYLYELEVDESDIVFTSDLNHYNDAKDAITACISPDAALDRYCTFHPPLDHHTGPRIEVLVRKALVIRLVASK